MTTQDSQPFPDLANYGTGMGEEYEWLISDHPWAKAERVRRAADYFAAELEEDDATVVEESERAAAAEASAPHPPAAVEAFSGVPPELSDAVGGLAEPPGAADLTVDHNQLPYEVADAEPDEQAVVRYRREYEEYRRANGEPGYEYPAHYVGAAAADHPPPGR
jgi:hypothetical protein